MVTSSQAESPHVFAGNPLDRADALRRDADALARAAADPEGRYLPLWNLTVLVAAGESPRLGWLSREQALRLDADAPCVFLGLADGRPHFAIDLSAVHDPAHELALGRDYRFDDARSAAMGLSTADTGILAQSRSQLHWHQRHRFCSACGARTEMHRGGHLRRCNGCDAEHFPRTDPVAIMLVTDGDRCLLGQSVGRLARTGMYSALAGFIDQGESIEEAVRREVMEEAGVEVGAVHYHSSQPWPFPSSLMIGCHATALTTEIHIDPAEMADVRWFSREQVQAALVRAEGGTPSAATQQAAGELRLPGPIAIAHHLLIAWARPSL